MELTCVQMWYDQRFPWKYDRDACHLYTGYVFNDRVLSFPHGDLFKLQMWYIIKQERTDWKNM